MSLGSIMRKISLQRMHRKLITSLASREGNWGAQDSEEDANFHNIPLCICNHVDMLAIQK